jgi:hypothetical protein
MNKRRKDYIKNAQDLLKESNTKANSGSFAYQLEANSLRSHIDELETYEAVESVGRTYELIDFRMIAAKFESGSIPLNILTKAANEIRKMIGYSALRFIQGGISKKRVPNSLYEELDLRLAGVLPGSSRLLIAAAAHRDLFDDGIAKHAIQRIMGVLETEGQGTEFLETVADLGPSSAKSLREFLKIIRANDGALELTWKYAGQDMQIWRASARTVRNVTSALEHTELREKEKRLLRGKIDLLSKRERIHLRTDEGETMRILFPKRLFTKVAELHLDQLVSLYCQVTVSENPLTNEITQHYELIEIQG